MTHDAPSPADPERFTHLLEQQHEVLLALRELTQQQTDAVHQQQMTTLLEVLNHKQRVLERFGVIQDELNQLGVTDFKRVRWRTASQLNRAADLTATNREMLSEMLAMEDASRAELQRGRDRVEQELQGLQDSTAAHRAYSKPHFGTVSQHDFGLT